MPATKLQPVCTSPATDLLSLLDDWLATLESGNLRPVLLRTLPAREELRWQDHDVDLLITPEHTRQLLQFAFAATLNGSCHVQIETKRRRKTQLILWNADASERLVVDLWHQWDQFATRRRSIPAAVLCELAARCESSDRGEIRDELRNGKAIKRLFSRDRSPLNAAARLPSELEFSLLVLHIHVKKRGAVSAVNHRRIQYLLKIVGSGDSHRSSEIADVLVAAVQKDLNCRESASPSSLVISRPTAKAAEVHLLSSLNPSHLQHSSNAGNTFAKVLRSFGTWFGRLLPRLGQKLLSSRAANDVAFVGSDGCGKTSLTHLLSSAHSGQWLSVVARKLYRRSVLYPIASSVTRRVLGISRSEFDDRLAPLLALRAMMACWMLLIGLRLSRALVRRPKRLLLDRSPQSMLVIERRTGKPRFSRLSVLMERFAPPLRHVLLLVPYAVLSQRKQEVTESAHGVYQQLLFEQIIRQPVVSCVLLSNMASPLAALEVLEEILNLSPDGAQRLSIKATVSKSPVPGTHRSTRAFTDAAEHTDEGDDRFLSPSAASSKKERAA